MSEIPDLGHLKRPPGPRPDAFVAPRVATPLGLDGRLRHFPGWLVPRNPGLWDGIPLGFSIDTISGLRSAVPRPHFPRDTSLRAVSYLRNSTRAAL